MSDWKRCPARTRPLEYFHLRPLPGNTWPSLPDSALAQVWAGYQELDRTQWLEPEELERCQLAQLRTLLAHCAAQVPYYRQLFAAAGISPAAVGTLDDFRRIPLLTRQLCQEQHAARCAATLPKGTLPGNVLKTSGSSGMPVQVPLTNMATIWWHAFCLRDLEWCQLEPSGSLAIIRTYGAQGEHLARLLAGVRTDSWRRDLHPLLEFGPSYAMDLLQQPRRQLEWLRGLQPHYLFSYPANAVALAHLAEEDGLGVPGLRAIHLISETLFPEDHARIAAAFGVPVTNTYSCTEAGYLASPCPDGPGCHVHAENVLFEVLDEHDRPCSPGTTGRVVLTPLHNFRAPFIRYEIGDQVTLGPGRCPCGRGLPWLTQVLGKQRVFFRLPNGQVKSSSPLATDLTEVGGHRQHQVVQRALDLVLVRIVPAPSWTAERQQRLLQVVTDFFEHLVRVEIELTEHLPPPPNGKFQCMVCEVAAPPAR